MDIPGYPNFFKNTPGQVKVGTWISDIVQIIVQGF